MKIYILLVILLLIILIVYLLYRLTKHNNVSESTITSAINFPKQIIFIRHGEKIESDSINLSGLGEAHANCWMNFFTNYLPTGINNIDSIYAMKQSKSNSSNRPIETITPLASKLGIKINSSYLRQDWDNIAIDVLTNNKGKTVLICCQSKT